MLQFILQARAAQFGIQGVDYRFAQGVIKNTIPAIASTNVLLQLCVGYEAWAALERTGETQKTWWFLNGVD